MKIKALFVFVIVIYFFPSYGQDYSSDSLQTGLKKNAIYGTLGTSVLTWVANVNYERFIGKTQKNTTYWYRVGYGGFAFLLGEVEPILIQV